jgi:hypothetical protein
MTAYGLAFISILWSRLDLVAATPILRNIHHVVIIGICALPLVLSLPQRVRLGMQYRNFGGIPNWPPYYAGPLNSKEGLKSFTTNKQIIFSDQPWATAWYADRVSIWLPPTRAAFEKLETTAADLQTPVAGIIISPTSHGAGSLTAISKNYKDFASLVLDGNVLLATNPSRPTSQFPQPVSIFNQDQHLEGISKRYPYRKPLVGLEMVYYGDRPIQNMTSQESK